MTMKMTLIAPMRRTLRGVALLLAAALAAVAAVSGCGGGVGTGGTGSYAQGAITGFGSVIVNDVRWDDSSATVVDGDGNMRSRDDLRLGMTVEIEGSAIASQGPLLVASAARVRYASEMRGPVDGIDLALGRLTLLGQTVQTGATTVFDDRLAGGLAALRVGDVIEVHAAYDGASGRYRATRIEPASGLPRLRGVVAGLDTGAHSFAIGDAVFHYAGASGVPAALANGDFVRLRLQPAGAGLWTVLAFDGGATAAPGEGLEAKVKGLISAFTSATQFSVNGQPVDASGAEFPDGRGLALGTRVEVEGTVRGGVLRAGEVKIESDDEQSGREFELHGDITAIDPQALTFVLRGVVVSYAGPDLEFKDGTAADLGVGVRVEVKGLLGAGGTLLEATEIEFDD